MYTIAFLFLVFNVGKGMSSHLILGLIVGNYLDSLRYDCPFMLMLIALLLTVTSSMMGKTKP
jgi:hypothetical protein